MAECQQCEWIKNHTKLRVYEDKVCFAVLEPKPAMFGHIILFPKEHATSISEIQEKTAAHLFKVSNKLSSIAFQGLGMHGTNILIHDGEAAGQTGSHFCIHIIPRKQGDGLNFDWPQKKLTDEEMSVVELTLKQETKSVGIFQKEKEEPVKIEKKAEKIEETTEENYLLKQLNRLP